MPKSEKTRNNLKVLVAEDHSFQREYVANCLNQIGIHQVVTATDGQEALVHFDEMTATGSTFDIIISDLHMPNMDGVAFIRNLAERNFKGGLIILTALDSNLVSSVTSMVREYELNIIGSLIKPVDTKKLIQYVSEISEKNNEEIIHPLPKGLIEQDLIDALGADCLTAYYQPRFNFSNGQITGFEALARLMLPNGQVVTPDDFLYLYTKLNRAAEFELRVYDQAFLLAQKALKLGKPLQLSINLCANMLGNVDFYEELVALAKKHKIPNDLVTIEVTERSLLDNIALSIEFLARLRINGFNLAIDDFGTGYSSIKQLELLPFNELKIDKSFLFDIENDDQKKAIVESTVDLAKRLKINTVAEGIETQAAWDLAKKYGCDVCQGYFTGRPMPLLEIEDLILV